MKTFTSEQLSKYFKVKVPSDGWTTQNFGDNSFIPDVLPNGQSNTNRISLYKYYGWLGHPAIDFGGDNRKYFVPFDGWVWKFKNYGGDTSMPWSVSFISKQEVEIDGQKVRLKINFVHVKTCNFTDGQEVKEGQEAGLTNNMGYPKYSSNPHLHYEHEPQYWNAYQWVSDINNGFNGMVHPRPFFSDWIFDIDKYPEGQLVKSEGPDIYLIEGRKKRLYQNQFSFWAHQRKAFSEFDIWYLPPFEIAKIPTGEPMSSGSKAMEKEINRIAPNLIN